VCEAAKLRSFALQELRSNPLNMQMILLYFQIAKRLLENIRSSSTFKIKEKRAAFLKNYLNLELSSLPPCCFLLEESRDLPSEESNPKGFAPPYLPSSFGEQ
jgi:hypothetical protein